MDLSFDFDDQIEQIAKIPKAVRLAIVSGVLLLILGGYWFFLYQPQADQLATQREEAQQLQRELSNIRAVVTNIAAFEEEVEQLEHELKIALKQLPNGKQFEDLLRDISTAGKQVGVSIESISRENEVPHDFYAEVPFQLVIEGTYHDLARFFERVGKLPRIVNVGSLNIKVAKESRSGTLLRVEGTATTFRFLNDAPRATAQGTPLKTPGRA